MLDGVRASDCPGCTRSRDQVVATARNPGSLSGLASAFPGKVQTTALDVTKPGDAARAVALADETFGGLDILVNNAGFGFIGAIEEATPEEYRPMFEANVFGLIETTRAALPSLRRKRGGRVVNMSSGAGIKGMQGSGYYNATKFAVEGLSEALAQEVAPFGMAVIIVEPGPFRTDFLGRSMAMAKRELPEYAATAGVFRAYRADNDGKQVGDPDKAIKVMFKAIDSDDPPLHLPLGPRAYALSRAKIAEFHARHRCLGGGGHRDGLRRLTAARPRVTRRRGRSRSLFVRRDMPRKIRSVRRRVLWFRFRPCRKPTPFSIPCAARRSPRPSDRSRPSCATVPTRTSSGSTRSTSPNASRSGRKRSSPPSFTARASASSNSPGTCSAGIAAACSTPTRR